MATNYREVRRGTVEIQYWIIEHDMADGSKRYDWRRDDDHESLEYFETADEAEEDAKYG